jgi:hypothetical protein
MSNNGFRIEDAFREKMAKTNGSITFKGLDNSKISFKYDEVARKNSSSHYKADVRIYLNNLKIAGFSVKMVNGKSRATILNQTGIANFLKFEIRTHISAEPAIEILNYLIDNQKSGIYLHEFSSMSEWSDILEYFLFDGTATRDCDPDQKAEYLVDIDAKDNENITVITREQAVEHAWRKLKAERRSGNQLVIRY